MINIKIDSSNVSGEVDVSLKGSLSDMAFELAVICSSVIGAIEEDTSVEVGNEIRKGLAKYLVTSIIDGDPLKDARSQSVAIDSRAYDFIKQYAKMRDEGRFD